jgi:hypothetical protein
MIQPMDKPMVKTIKKIWVLKIFKRIILISTVVLINKRS